MRHVMPNAMLLMHAKEAHVVEKQERTEQLFERMCECLYGKGLKNSSGMLAIAQHQSAPTVS